MHNLCQLGWLNRCDTFDSYYKKINHYEIVVSRHISEEKWQCTLVEWNENGTDSDEITISYDCDFYFVTEITNLLTKTL